MYFFYTNQVCFYTQCVVLHTFFVAWPNKSWFTLFCREIRFVIYAFFGVNFILRKFCLCKRNDKYEVCKNLKILNTLGAWRMVAAVFIGSFWDSTSLMSKHFVKMAFWPRSFKIMIFPWFHRIIWRWNIYEVFDSFLKKVIWYFYVTCLHPINTVMKVLRIKSS